MGQEEPGHKNTKRALYLPPPATALALRVDAAAMAEPPLMAEADERPEPPRLHA